MSIFTTNELQYFTEQRIGRLATVDEQGGPHVVPVGFHYSAESDTVEIGGHNFAQTRKWRDIKRHTRVAFVIDDVLPPWQPRSVEILADAERLEAGGEKFGPGYSAEFLRLHPVRVIAWGLDPEGHTSRAVANGEPGTSKNHVIVRKENQNE